MTYEESIAPIRWTWIDRMWGAWCAAYTGTEETGLVRSTEIKWCAVKVDEKPKEPANFISTVCGRCVVLPMGVSRRIPTCLDCRRILSGGAFES